MIVVVTGMKREAKIIGGSHPIVVAGGDASILTNKLGAAAVNARAVLSIGIGGGLAPDLAVGAVVLATEIVSGSERLPADAAWRGALRDRLPGAVIGAIAGTGTIVATLAAKSTLRGETGALLADMESYAAARFAAERKLPFAALRIVSDNATQSLPPAVFGAIGPDGEVKLGAVLRSIAYNPLQIPDLIRTARNTNLAMAVLRRCSDLLGDGFACPYLV